MTDEGSDFKSLSVISNDDKPVVYDRILDVAISQGAPLEVLEKWMDLKRKHEEDESRREFYQAVADFKSEKIIVTKDKENNQFRSKYTSLGNLLNTVNPVLGKYGLSVSFGLNQSENSVTVSCNLRHRLGHSETVSMTAPPDTSGGNSKNPIQQIKSTITYLRAATFEAVTGLASSDATVDDDGNGAYTPEFIGDDEKDILIDLISATDSDNPAFWKYAQAETVDTITTKNYKRIVSMLEKKLAKQRDPGEDDA